MIHPEVSHMAGEIGVSGEEKTKGGENMEKSGLPTIVYYIVTEEVQKKLAEQEKYAGKKQKAYIRITDENLKKHVRMTSEGIGELELRGYKGGSVNKQIGLLNYNITHSTTYPKRGDVADGWVSRKVYELQVLDDYEFDKVIESEQDILDAIEQCNKKKAEIEEKIKELQKQADEEHEKKRKEYIEKKLKEQEEKERKRREERERIFSKPWVKALVEENEIARKREQEIQRFKEKFALSDDEIETWNTSNEPFVHIQSNVDLEPVGIKRKIIIRNFAPGDYAETLDGYDDAFSDLSWFIAKKLAKIFNGEVLVYGDDENYPDYVYLVVKTENDYLEVASTQL